MYIIIIIIIIRCDPQRPKRPPATARNTHVKKVAPCVLRNLLFQRLFGTKSQTQFPRRETTDEDQQLSSKTIRPAMRAPELHLPFKSLRWRRCVNFSRGVTDHATSMHASIGGAPLFRQRSRCIISKTWNRTTASVLKQDPNTHTQKRFKGTLIYFMCPCQNN